MLLAVSETGSLTKAAAQLGLSQPAVSSQMKRLEVSIGGAVFSKGINGSVATPLGELVIRQAQRVIEAHDQMLRLRGNSLVDVPTPIRLGISNLYVDQYLKTGDSNIYRSLTVHADTSTKIAKQFADGFVDIACIFQSGDTIKDMSDFIVDENQEIFVWARSKDFVLSPGSPIPIVSCPGGVTDSLMLTSLSKAQLPYRIAFNSSDYRANLSAAAAGLGLTVIPVRMLPPDLVEAKEYYLPRLMPANALLYARPDAHREKETAEALANLSSIFFAEPKLPKLAA